MLDAVVVSCDDAVFVSATDVNDTVAVKAGSSLTLVTSSDSEADVSSGSSSPPGGKRGGNTGVGAGGPKKPA